MTPLSTITWLDSMQVKGMKIKTFQFRKPFRHILYTISQWMQPPANGYNFFPVNHSE